MMEDWNFKYFRKINLDLQPEFSLAGPNHRELNRMWLLICLRVKVKCGKNVGWNMGCADYGWRVWNPMIISPYNIQSHFNDIVAIFTTFSLFWILATSNSELEFFIPFTFLFRVTPRMSTIGVASLPTSSHKSNWVMPRMSSRRVKSIMSSFPLFSGLI